MKPFDRKPHATGRDGPRIQDARYRKRNQPPEGQAFVWITNEMLSSPAWIALPDNAMRGIMRIAQEHMAHGGRKNGELPVTWNNFQAYGIRRGSITDAIKAFVALGFVRMAGRGRPTNGRDKGSSSLWTLTWLMTADGEAATNDWRRIKSAEDATEKLRSAGVTPERKKRTPTQDIISSAKLIPSDAEPIARKQGASGI